MINGISDIFEGRLLNKPEIMLEGQVAKKVRCEYTYILTGGIMVLFIELKLNLGAMNDDGFSDIVGQVFAEADGTLAFKFI